MAPNRRGKKRAHTENSEEKNEVVEAKIKFAKEEEDVKDDPEEVGVANEEGEEANETPAPIRPSLKGRKKIKKRADKEKKQSEERKREGPLSAVIKLVHIPFGFFERELDGYFRQFGTVQRVRVLRNRKGNHNGVAFVRFENEKVAAIAAQTMNGYLLAEKRLGCRVLFESEVPFCVSRESGGRYGYIAKPFEHRRKHAEQHAAERTREQEHRQLKHFVQALRKKAKKIATLGIDYDCKWMFDKLERWRKTKEQQRLDELRAKHAELFGEQKDAEENVNE